MADIHCSHCASHEERILTGELRAEFQGQALKWLAILSPIIISATFLALTVIK